MIALPFSPAKPAFAYAAELLSPAAARVLLAGGIAFAALGPFVRAHADAGDASRPLAGNELRRTVSGKRIYLATPFGGEFPLYYRADGRVDGTGEALGLGRFLKPTDSGRWWVDGSKLCQQWQSWYNGKVSCFEVTDRGNGRIGWVRDDGDRGIARLGE